MFARALLASILLGGTAAGTTTPAAAPSPTTPTTPVAAYTAVVRIDNKSESAVEYVYISPCSTRRWGDDQLGTEVISAGEAYRWRVATGCYDVKAVLVRDGGSIEWHGLQLDTGEIQSLVLPTQASVRSANLIS